jgi:hypothetical protein
MESKHQHLIDKLNGYLDTLYESGCLLEDEEEGLNKLNDDIVNLILSQEKRIAELEEKYERF